MRVKYHGCFDALREAAEAGCDLCNLVRAESDNLLAELAEQKEYPGIGKAYSAPSFNMWLTQRPAGAQGFLILSEVSNALGTSKRPGTFMAVAAFGVVAEDGMNKTARQANTRIRH